MADVPVPQFPRSGRRWAKIASIILGGAAALVLVATTGDHDPGPFYIAAAALVVVGLAVSALSYSADAKLTQARWEFHRELAASEGLTVHRYDDDLRYPDRVVVEVDGCKEVRQVKYTGRNASLS